MPKDDNANIHGLPRYIPTDVRRAVRRAAGFGCVICGNAVCQYEHVDPPFEYAREHDPAKITYLCGGCHDKVTRGIWSKQKVKDAMQKPTCKQTGFSFGAFDIQGFPALSIGDMQFRDTPIILEIEDVPLIAVAAPEEPRGPFLLSALFLSDSGEALLEIRNNEWFANAENWDVEVVGARIFVRLGAGNIPLVLRAKPPDGLAVEHLDMQFRDVRMYVDEPTSVACIQTPRGRLDLVHSPVHVFGQRAGIVLRQGGLSFGG
jgi:hypothetical protein